MTCSYHFTLPIWRKSEEWSNSSGVNYNQNEFTLAESKEIFFVWIQTEK